MGELIPLAEHIKVFERDGQLWTTSLNVAEVFEIAHDEVLRRIKNVQCSQEFNLRNFAEISYRDSRNREQPLYELTRDGFTFLAMGFTGAKAAQFKEKYIEAFNQMESAIKRQIESNAGHSLMISKILEDLLVSSQDLRKSVQCANDSINTVGVKVNKVEIKVDKVESDVCAVKGEVETMKRRIEDVQNAVESKRRREPRKKDMEQHVLFQKNECFGLCQCCHESQILDETGQPIKDVFHWGHMRGPNENASDKIWPVCADCNRKMSNYVIPDRVTEALFAAYQVRFTKWSDKRKKQLPMFFEVTECQ